MSVAGSIADTIVTAIQGLNLTGVASGSVVRRKTPSLPAGKDPIQIVVTVGEETVEPLTARKDLVKYPCAVTIITSGGHKLADDDTLRTWREQIRVAVNKPACFAAVAEFNQVDPVGKAPFNAAGLAKDLNVSQLIFTVQTLETRAQ